MGMADRTWEWRLPNGESLIARFDATLHVESIWIGPRLVSRSPQGGKSEGHAVALGPGKGPYEANVLFGANGTTCTVRIEGQELLPVRMPDTIAASSARSEGGSAGFLLRFGITVLLFAVAAGAAFIMIRRGREEQVLAEGTIDKTFASPNGLFIAHHSAAFKPSVPPKLPPDVGVVALLNKKKDESVFVLAFLLPSTIPDDPWKLHETIQKGFVKGLMGEGATYEETERKDEICLGEPGAVVRARTHVENESGWMWSCTFVHAGYPYRVMYVFPDRNGGDEALLRKMVDATELTVPAVIATPQPAYTGPPPGFEPPAPAFTASPPPFPPPQRPNAKKRH
jgi:hypothetical protein